MEESKYSVYGNYITEKGLVTEERNYKDAQNEQQAIEIALKDGHVGPGIVFQNLGEVFECDLNSFDLKNLSEKKLNKSIESYFKNNS